MEDSVGKLTNNAQALTDRAADKIHGGIRDAGSMLTSAVSRAQAIGRHVSDAAQSTGAAASDTSEAIVKYTKKNPVKMLLIAAATGALLYAGIRALTPSREQARRR